MKKLVCGVLCSAATAAFAASSTVTTVDVIEINSTLTNTLVAVSALDLATGTGSVAVSNIVKTTNLSVGDKLYTFSNGNYECWTLGTGKVWEKSENIFTVGADGKLSDSAGTPANIATLPVGEGFWLCRSNPTGSFYVYGAHSATTVSTVPGGVSAALVGNPRQSGAAPVSISNLAVGDQIAFPQNGSLKRYTCVDAKGTGTWWVAGKEGAFPTVTAGTGFWYIPKDTNGRTINW